MEYVVGITLTVIPFSLAIIAYELWLMLDLLNHMVKIGREIVAKTEFGVDVSTPIGDFGVEAGAGKDGVNASAQVAVNPQAGPVLQGAAGAMAYNWLSTLAGPMTPFLIVGAGLTWLGVKQYKLHKAAKG